MTADKRLRRLDFSESTRPPSGARLRVPSAGEIQGMLTSGSVDEAVVLSRVRKLLERMNREGRLRGLVNIESAMHELFPLPGYLDQAAFECYINPTDREMVYHSVQEAYTIPHEKDRENLKIGLESAAGISRKAANDKAGREDVFGSDKQLRARVIYLKITDWLESVIKDIENRITTDYNSDAKETFVGGWASFEKQQIHLDPTVVTNPQEAESKVIILHEAAHIAASRIKDYVYYDAPIFEAADQETKIDNAAHYEELPRRILGISRYKSNKVFKPGISSSGTKITTEDEIRASATYHYQLAWDAAADFDFLIKQARRDQLDSKYLDEKTLDRLREVSPLMDLTLHEQTVSPINVTTLDITTSESIVRSIGLAGEHVKKLDRKNIVPDNPRLTRDQKVATGTDLAVNAAMVAYGGILGDAARDRTLVDWLYVHHEKVLIRER